VIGTRGPGAGFSGAFVDGVEVARLVELPIAPEGEPDGASKLRAEPTGKSDVGDIGDDIGGADDGGVIVESRRVLAGGPWAIARASACSSWLIWLSWSVPAAGDEDVPPLFGDVLIGLRSA
jgi:hypothetical protein